MHLSSDWPSQAAQSSTATVPTSKPSAAHADRVSLELICQADADLGKPAASSRNSMRTRFAQDLGPVPRAQTVGSRGGHACRKWLAAEDRCESTRRVHAEHVTMARSNRK